MATFTVTNTNDSGAGSLRQAMASAEANGVGADTVVFAAGLAGQTIRLTSGGLFISSGTVTIEGDSNGDGDADVTISGDRTGNGKSADDIGIMLWVENAATVNLDSMALADGRGSGNYYGTGIAGILNIGTLNVRDTSIRNMTAYGLDGESGSYGENGFPAVAGIFNLASLTVTDTIFQGNIASGGHGGDASGDGNDGGNGGVTVAGVLNSSGAQLTIQNSGFVSHTAFQGNGGNGAYGYFNGGDGGDTGDATTGIFNEGTITGLAAYASQVLGYGFVGYGGGSANTPGAHGGFGTNHWLLINSGTATGFTQLTYQSLSGNVSGATTAGNDTIVTSFAGPVFGLTGNDTITGGNGTQSLYGGSGNDILNGGFYTDYIYGGSGNDTIFVTGNSYFDNVHGGTGIDTLDHSTANFHIGTDTLNFNTGQLTINSTGQGILATSGIEIFRDNNNGNTIIASAFGMTVFGNGGNDTITGLAGIDTLNGGANTSAGDTLSYSLSITGVTVNVALNTAAGGHATGDTISGFENLTGSAFGDTLTGSTAQNTLRGNNGNDSLNGSNNNDQLFGDAGDDTLIGSEGADIINGGTNTAVGDTASYTNSAGFVTVDLVAGTATGSGHGAGDTLTGIENVIGSAFNDTLTGDGTNNVLTGGNGRDTLIGGAGADTLNGQNGDDTLVGGAGADVINGGGGNHDMVDYSASGAGVLVDLRPGQTGFSSDAAGDTWTGVEDVTGSNFGDTLIGSTAANMLLGGSGGDALVGGAGGDILNGGAGDRDAANYDGSNSGVNVDLLAGTASGGHAAGDTLIGIEDLVGSDHNDTLTGNNLVNNLTGDGGNDTLNGNGNGDSLNGGSGDDTLNGGTGNDTFIFQNPWGDDIINGWVNGQDKIYAVNPGTLTHAAFTETQVGADTLLTLTADPTRTIRITNTLATTIDQGDFL